MPSPSKDPVQLDWVGSSKTDLLGFPQPVIKDVGYALNIAQFGGKHPSAKPFKGAGSGVFEIVEDHSRDTYRAVYAVKFSDRIYVLHCFQKKSKTGIKTSQQDINLIKSRLKTAKADHKQRQQKKRAKK